MDEHRRQNVIIAIGVVAGHNVLRSVEILKYEESSDDEYDRWNREANVWKHGSVAGVI